MRFLTADYLYPLNTEPIKNGVLQITEQGEVINIFKSRRDISSESLEIYNGILCPGFINAHCHLELSHLLGLAERNKGLLNFIETMQKRSNYRTSKILEAIENAETQMINNGIVAVGDICNTADTLFQKQKRNLQYYNFIEIFGIRIREINSKIDKGLSLREKFRDIGQKATIVPHAPYSVMPALMKKIASNFDDYDYTFSLHTHEIKSENQLFNMKNGQLFEWLNNKDADPSIWDNRDNFSDILDELFNNKTIMVHNTYVKKEDLSSNYYCTCPSANLYIENRLPNYKIFNEEKLCVGTDGLSSNISLSILEELKIINKNSEYDLNTLLKIACKNGAEALGFKDLGTFEKGKSPGVNLLKNLDEVKVLL